MFIRLFTNILEISAATSLVILGLKLLFPLLSKNYTAKWKFWVWMILAIRLILPFNFSLPQAPVQFSIPESPIMVSETQTTMQQSVQAGTPVMIHTPLSQQAAAPPVHTISFIHVLVFIWLSGVAIFMFYQFAGYHLFRKQALRWSRPISDKDIADKIKHISYEMNLKTSVTALTSEEISSPMMMGFLKPLLFLPHEDYTDEELDLILRHELVHLKRHDTGYKLLLLFANAVHWFNPFVWLMMREAECEIEIYCDETVVYGQMVSQEILRSHLFGYAR
ncbi:M56 family metallopeptidase [Lutispora sp.]|uniref:M56 family metallopeptidase n=1 Tax=Lutispora sp. TaxID=2828727 RepID=UPI002B202F73|nr:M56 family metallopeptidase [Lutispora sp.]MEA4962215.1 M56 family metallopeptidase [Lutispora sp.]